jgi:undecaprenyl diphosphate synthase
MISLAASEPMPEATSERVPRHVAIIMDGNGRWAKQRNRPRSFGHRAGVKSVRASVEFCLRQRIEALTLFAFSSENWSRPPTEVNALMQLFLRALDREVDQLHKNGVRVRFIGELSAFSPALLERMQRAMDRTAGNAALTLAVAVNYGGRWDIAQAARRSAEAVVRGEIAVAQITPEWLATQFSLSDLPDPDLFIRTGGEQRISNFLLWQMAYCELVFTDVLWPDFGQDDLQAALIEFRGRERRFGKTSAQVAKRT